MARLTFFSVLAAAVSPVLFTSCLQVGLDSVGTKVVHERKGESIGPWKGRKVGETAALQYVGERTAVLVGGDTRIDFEFNRTSFTMRANSSAGDFSIGSAAAVAPDGYYLTAAHCLNEKGLRLIAYTNRGLLYTQEVRTVWNGTDQGMDLALIHVSTSGLRYFMLADSSALYPGAEVLAAGVGGLEQSQSGGEILSIREKGGTQAAPWKQVIHSSPLIKGDSGGPVMDSSGKLVGITSTGGAFGLAIPGANWVHAWRSGAIWVDREWLRMMIAEDRKKPRGRDGSVVLMPATAFRKRSGSQ